MTVCAAGTEDRCEIIDLERRTRGSTIPWIISATRGKGVEDGIEAFVRAFGGGVAVGSWNRVQRRLECSAIVRREVEAHVHLVVIGRDQRQAVIAAGSRLNIVQHIANSVLELSQR